MANENDSLDFLTITGVTNLNQVTGNNFESDTRDRHQQVA